MGKSFILVKLTNANSFEHSSSRFITKHPIIIGGLSQSSFQVLCPTVRSTRLIRKETEKAALLLIGSKAATNYELQKYWNFLELESIGQLVKALTADAPGSDHTIGVGPDRIDLVIAP